MNKYQEYLLKDCLYQNFIFYRCCPLQNEVEGSNIQFGTFDKDADTFTLTQDEDITIVDYVLIVKEDPAQRTNIISRISILDNGQWKDLELSSCGQQELGYKILLNFNNRIEKIKLSFKNDLSDDYILNLKYVEADKEKYYAKQAQEKKNSLLKTASIKHSTGNDLVNIYFQPCCDDYERTEITLYKDSQMLAKYKVDEGTFFKSITGLAFGAYEYILKQYDKSDKLLLETEKIKFTISAPYYGGRNVVFN